MPKMRVLDALGFVSLSLAVGACEGSDDLPVEHTEHLDVYPSDEDRVCAGTLDDTVWQLVAGEVTSPGVGATMPRDHLVWRDGLVSADVEVKLEFRVRSPDPRNEPHVLARLTDDALQPGGAYHGYALLPRAAKGGTPMQLCMMRFDGARDPGEQRCENLPAPLEIGPTRHRLVLQVTGPGPVLIDGRLDVLHDGDQDWTPLLTLQQWQDTSPDQIVTAGTAGFSGGSVIDVLDNFAIEGVQIFTFG